MLTSSVISLRMDSCHIYHTKLGIESQFKRSNDERTTSAGTASRMNQEDMADMVNFKRISIRFFSNGESKSRERVRRMESQELALSHARLFGARARLLPASTSNSQNNSDLTICSQVAAKIGKRSCHWARSTMK